MGWKVSRTDSFAKEVRKYLKDGEFSKALGNKIKRLKEDPESVGGYLSGKLHGYKATRLIRTFRLIFKISEDDRIVWLVAVDDRGHVYGKK